MYIPIRKRIGLGELLIVGAVGVCIQLYAWAPTIQEKLEKEKLEREKQLKKSTETDAKT